VLPEDSYLTSDDIPLAAPGTPIEGRAERSDAYPVVVTSDADTAHRSIADLAAGRRIMLVTDDTVLALHGTSLVSALRSRGVEVEFVSVPPGERSKDLSVAVKLLDRLAHSPLGRRDLIVAFGGGVVIDMAGWVASAYMRGVPYVNVPTTLLAHVDAALGGKVAVDHPVAKNLIGAFYQPTAVISHIGYLASLDGRQVRAGLAEAVKKAIIASPQLFGFIESNVDELLARQPQALEQLVRCASAIKCELIARDPYEQELRRALNFGHTVGHAVETVTGYGPVLHGEAVALGMAVAARISLARGWFAPHAYDRLIGVLHRIGLPHSIAQLETNVDADAVIGALGKIRLIRDGSLRFVLPVDVGRVAIVDDVTEDEVARSLSAHVRAAAS
jgi:3-dehydroquinate synthase